MIIILVLAIIALIVSCACIVHDLPKVGMPALFVAIGLLLVGGAQQAREQHKAMRQCVKSGGQWVQYSRSGFECVRAER